MKPKLPVRSATPAHRGVVHGDRASPAPGSAWGRARRARPVVLLTILMAAAAAGALLAGCTLPSPPAPARYALVYGVSRYVDARGEGSSPNLTWTDDDARSMAALLEADGYTVTLRTNAEATKANLDSDLASIGRAANSGDLVLFYFSGHGGELSDFGISEQEASGLGYPPESRWVFLYGSISPDMSTAWLTTADMHLEQAVYDGELADMLDTTALSKKLVIIDACNSGGFIVRGHDTDAVPPAYAHFTGVDRSLLFSQALSFYLRSGQERDESGIAPSRGLVLSAAGAAEFSYETNQLAHGVFTYFLLEAAAAGDLNGDGAVSAVEAYSYARAGIEESWNSQYADTTFVFSPHISGGAVDLILFAHPQAAAAAGARAPAANESLRQPVVGP